MLALKIARWLLLASLLVYAAALALGASELIPPDAAFLLALVAMFAIIECAAACVIIQVALFLRRAAK